MSGFSNSRELGRPLTIKDEGVSLHDNVASIDLVGPGVAGAVLGDEVTETISGGVGTPETPVGDINGSNVTFTITAVSLTQLFLNGILQEEGVKFTLSGTTITYTTAPRAGTAHVAFVV